MRDVQGNVDPFNLILDKISKVIHKAQMSVSLKSITTPENRDIQLDGLFSFMLNRESLHQKNNFGNSFNSLPQLNLNKFRQHDLNLAISEPFINEVLDVVNSTNLFNHVLGLVSSVECLNIKNVKLHFSNNNSIVVVINSEVDLKKIKSNSIKSWFKNNAAAFLERNNNDSVIYFPLEITVIPEFKVLIDGRANMILKVLSPFNQNQMLNHYNYPSNMGLMNETVRLGVLNELKLSLEKHTNQDYILDFSKILNQSGVIFRPTGISIQQGAFLLLNMDILDINFNSKKIIKK
jgi:hypothetical protein